VKSPPSQPSPRGEGDSKSLPPWGKKKGGCPVNSKKVLFLRETYNKLKKDFGYKEECQWLKNKSDCELL
jgi:hypothetical protein